MKKVFLIFFMLTLLTVTGCKNNQKSLYLPEATNDNIFTTVGGGDEVYQGEGYHITVPTKNYRYEKEYDDGHLEETWEYTKKEDVKIQITTYKNSDELSARGHFLKENEDYIFEDFTGYSLCGMEPDGDTLWFHLYEKNKTVYIVSWEYPKNTSEKLQKELSNIAQTFQLT